MVEESGVPGRGLTAAALIGGVLFLAGGLIFLCAAVDNLARMPISLALLVIGAGLAAWAGTPETGSRDGVILNLSLIHISEPTRPY